MIPVTKPFSPPIEEYQEFLKGIWDRNWYTNNGPLVLQLEKELKEYLELPHLLYLTNGTVALQIAIKALGITKEIITTPFSYVATTSSIVWEGCTPVFVDIDPDTLNIDPAKIEDSITSETEAILATHCFGNPCDIDAIGIIAKKYNLKVIYDAAHCFGTKYKGKSVFSYGDVSTVSFHATKLYHTIEGGAVFASDPEVLKRMSYMRNFGHDGPERFEGVGINGKNSEFHAAMGIVNLRYMDEILKKRKESHDYYSQKLMNDKVKFQRIKKNVVFNYSYFPMIFASHELMAQVKDELERRYIYPRRYFYPSLNNLDYVTGSAPQSENITSRILCLPLFYDLSKEDQDLVVQIISNSINE